MNRRRVLALLAGFCAATATQYAASADNTLQEYLQELTALQADFRQTVFDENGETMQQSSGTMSMQRPGRFRWDYREPFEQLIVADGDKLWLYDVELEQVTVRSMDEALSAAPLAVLSGAAPIEDAFEIARSYQADGATWYELTPIQSESEFNRLKIALTGNVLTVIELADGLQRRTRLTLDNVQRNPELDDKLFQFVPPTGVDVIGG